MKKMNIVLRLHTQKLLRKYLLASGVSLDELPALPSAVNLDDLAYWLSRERIRHSQSSKNQKRNWLLFPYRMSCYMIYVML